MTVFLDLPVLVRALLIMEQLVSVFSFLYCAIASLIYRFKPRTTLLLFFLTLLAVLTLYPMHLMQIYSLRPAAVPFHIARLPVIWIYFILALWLAAAILSCQGTYLASRTRITLLSIKQGVDLMPKGLLFFDESGRPHLANHQIHKLSVMLTGKPVRNGWMLWDFLKAGNAKERRVFGLHDESLILQMSDGSIWGFSIQRLPLGKTHVYQVLATSLEEEWRQSQRLQEQVKKLRQVNERLRQYNKRVADVAKEEELLSAKVQIHDRIGKMLIGMRLMLNESVSPAKACMMVEDYRGTIRLFRSGFSDASTPDQLEALQKAAAYLGITVECRGLKKDEDGVVIHLLLASARECLTNAARHADADKLSIDIRHGEKGVSITYTNNGRPPRDSGVVESGGLLSLRSIVEKAGALLTIVSSPAFMLTIDIPRTPVSDGLPFSSPPV